MATGGLLLRDLLCFLKCKFGKIAVKALKSSVLDFFQIEDLCEAKTQLLHDIRQLNSVDLPHIPDRRAGSDQAVRVIDDIFTALTCVDDRLKMSELPCYVSKSPDCMPSTRLYEGDLCVLMNLLTKMDGYIVDNSTAVAAIANDLNIVKSVATDYIQVCRFVNNNACDRGTVAAAMDTATMPLGKSTQLSDQDLVFARSADDQTAPSTTQLNWAAVASSLPLPVVHPNQFAVLDTEEECDSDGRPFTEFHPRRKRRRQRTSQPAQQQSSVIQTTGEQPQSQQNSRRQQSSSKRILLGKSTAANSSLAAAQPIKKKAVFCLDNISPSVSANDVRSYVSTSMLIDVVSCFKVKPRRFRYGPSYDRRAFRLCIFDADRDRLLDASKWPDSITIGYLNGTVNQRLLTDKGNQSSSNATFQYVVLTFCLLVMAWRR